MPLNLFIMKNKTKKTKNMSTRPLTHVIFLLDKSGSMGKTRQSALNGFNEQVQKFKSVAKDQDVLFSLITFNEDVYEHIWDRPIEELNEANEEDYITKGGTAFRDAQGYAIQKMLDTTNTEDPNAAYLMICISDGETWDDQHYKVGQLRELIGSVEATGKWTISYMGCSEDYMYKLSKETGISPSNMAAWSNSTHEGTTRGMKMATARSDGYFAMRAKGMTASSTYMNDQVDCVASFVPDAKAENVKIVENLPWNPVNTSPNVNGVVPTPVAKIWNINELKATPMHRYNLTKNIKPMYKSASTGTFGNTQVVEWES